MLAAIEHAGDLRRPAGQDSATVAAELATKLVEEHLGKPAALAKAIDSAADDIVREQARRQLTAKIATEADAAAGRFVVEHSDSVLAAFGKALDAPIAVLAGTPAGCRRSTRRIVQPRLPTPASPAHNPPLCSSVP